MAAATILVSEAANATRRPTGQKKKPARTAGVDEVGKTPHRGRYIVAVGRQRQEQPTKRDAAAVVDDERLKRLAQPREACRSEAVAVVNEPMTAQ